MKNESIMLLSGGLDSAVNMACGVEEGTIGLAITFDYGQRAAKNEIESSQKLCNFYKVEHLPFDLKWLKGVSKSYLTKSNVELPSPKLDEKSETEKSASAVWVPNRNALFINIAASIAEGLNYSKVLVGFNAEEAKTFPDNSEAFLKSINETLTYSTMSKVRVETHTGHMNKREIVSLGTKLRVPFEYIWPCYNSGIELCRVCESCKRYLAAQKEAGLS